MQAAQYRGKSLVSLAIRLLTRGCYSHTAFRFDAVAQQAAISLTNEGYQWGKNNPYKKSLQFFSEGSVCEAWGNGFQNVTSISSNHTPTTKVDLFNICPPLLFEQEKNLIKWLDSHIGTPYAFRDVIRFVTKRKGGEKGRMFCSESFFNGLASVGVSLFNRTDGWEVSPVWIPKSLRLTFDKSLYTL